MVQLQEEQLSSRACDSQTKSRRALRACRKTSSLSSTSSSDHLHTNLSLRPGRCFAGDTPARSRARSSALRAVDSGTLGYKGKVKRGTQKAEGINIASGEDSGNPAISS